MFKFVGKTLLIGLLTTLPIIVTIAILAWLGSKAEGMFATIGEQLLGDWYKPGMGLATTVLLIFGIGLLAQLPIFKQLGTALENMILGMPVIRSIYGSVKDLTDFFNSSKKKDMGQVVMVQMGEQRMMGLLTRDRFDDLPAGFAGPDKVAVYFPMSYQLGGFTLIMDRSRVEPIDMKLDDAMKFALTAGMKKTADAEPAR